MSTKIGLLGIGFVLIISVAVLSSSNKAMADSLLPCCNNQMCEWVNVVKCEGNVGARTYESECADVTITCKQCVDYTVSGCLCSGYSNYCQKNDGTYYYGSHINCNL